MITTTITCNRCGCVLEPNAFLVVNLRWRTCSYPSFGSGQTMEYCRDCMIKMGLINPYTEEEKEIIMETPAPTIEDLIHQIVEDHMQG
jgi:hypothetical protein